MPNIQIKNVPEDIHRIYRRRAADAGQSLQEYMHEKLTNDARQSTLADVFGRMEASGEGVRMTGDEIAALIREDRESH